MKPDDDPTVTIPQIAGLSLGRHLDFNDERGSFIKFYDSASHPTSLTHPKQIFMTSSLIGVLRGMHIQVPPYASNKVVSLISGSIIDVVVDVRYDSDSFGQFQVFHLDALNRPYLNIPSGCAHGFAVTSESADILYTMDNTYDSQYDLGFHVSSFGYTWPEFATLLSERDNSQPSFVNFLALHSKTFSIGDNR